MSKATDPATLERLTSTLRTIGGATPAGAGYWEALAGAAATELTRTITIIAMPIPDARFFAGVQTLDSVSARLIIDLASSHKTRSEAMLAATEHIRAIGSGTAVVVETVFMAQVEVQG